MRPWLLLVSLLVSDLSPLGDGDWVIDYCCWSLCRNLAPTGMEILETQTEHQYIKRNYVQHKLGTPPFYWTHTVHDDHGCLYHQEFTGIIHRNHVPALAVSLLRGKGKSVPAFLLRSDALPALHAISETSHIAMDLIKDPPDPESAWTLNHHTAASGHNFQAFLLEKSKSLAPATIVQLQKMLTKRYCAAATVNISCCFKQGEIRSAMNIKKMSKEQIARLQIRQKESTRRAMDILMKYGGQAAVRQHDVFQAATLHSGSASMKASHVPQSEKNRSSVNMIKKKEHLISSLQNSAQKQHRLKSGVYDDDDDDDDGFYIEKQLLLVPREKAKSMKRLQFKIKAAQEDNKEDFN
ncbi:hypothetical protein FQN60_008129, partial [Etheostoma spectabile]